MKPKPVLVLVLVCLVWTMCAFASEILSPKGDIRCSCNEVTCVRTGYMCKSTLSVCYSVVIPATDGGRSHFRSTHGCADTLPEETRSACVTGNDEYVDREPAQPDRNNQRLLCCSHDMCNYIDGASVVLLSAIAANGSADRTPPDFDRDRSTVMHGSSGRELWLRVALIAVPLIGLFVLTLLVVAAVRMLRGGDLRCHPAIRAVDAAAFDRRQTGDKPLDDGGLYSDRGDLPTMCWLECSDERCCDAGTGKVRGKWMMVRGSDGDRICSREIQTFVETGIQEPLK